MDYAERMRVAEAGASLLFLYPRNSFPKVPPVEAEEELSVNFLMPLAMHVCVDGPGSHHCWLEGCFPYEQEAACDVGCVRL